MKDGKKETPRWQLVVLWALIAVGGLLAIQTFVWESLEESRDVLQQEVTKLDAETLLSMQRIGKLKKTQETILEIQDDFSLHVSQIPTHLDPKTFRMEVATIAKNQGVMIRIWKPQSSILQMERGEEFIPITLKVEGNFAQTLEFLGELTGLYWIHAIDAIEMGRKQGSMTTSTITTEITMLGMTPQGIQHVKELLAI